jgi:hypothetical protein
MKLNITEVRNLVAEVVREAITEAKSKKKEIPGRSEESIKAQREKQVRSTGYLHEPSYDFSQPLGDASIVKKQGASGMGGWTKGDDPRPPAYGKPNVKVEQQLRALIRMVVAEELRALADE